MYVITDGNKKWIGKEKIKTGLGIFSKDELNKAKEKGLSVFKAFFIDLHKKMGRGPAIIHKKDIGLIIAYTGLGANNHVAEAGSGTGFLTAYLARIVYPGKVYSYEINEKHLEIAKKNAELFELKNVIFKNKSIKEIEEKDLDAIILDLPDPWNYIEEVKNSLKIGGFLVCYLPTINQVLELLNHLQDFFEIEVLENFVRSWKINKDSFRPNNKALVHTAFLVFARRLK